jgi:hypothetical protein
MISIETLVCKDEEECQRKRERWEHLQNRFCALGQRELDMFRARMGDGKHKILCDKHFYKRSFERSISEADFKEVLKCGWVVERNKTAKATSIMLLGYVGMNYRPLHIVIDMVSENLWPITRKATHGNGMKDLIIGSVFVTRTIKNAKGEDFQWNTW